MREKIEYYKYVPHHQQTKWEAVGWVFHKDLGPPHAAYSSLYIWPHEHDPVVPPDTDVIITTPPRVSEESE